MKQKVCLPLLAEKKIRKKYDKSIANGVISHKMYVKFGLSIKFALCYLVTRITK